MKIFNKLIATLFVGVLGVTTFGVVFSNRDSQEAKATTPDATSYWSSVDADTLTAPQLFSAVNNIINTNVTKLTYDYLWTAYGTTDAVPGTSNPIKIWDMYGGYQFTYVSDQAGNCPQPGAKYNREHSIPKSWWGSTQDERYSDIVHLVPTDGYINNMRGNYAFGEVSSVSKHDYNPHSLAQRTDGYGNVIQISGDKEKATLGSGKTIDGNTAPSVVFEPPDQYKGDFARIYYYFATRYGPKRSDWNSSKIATSGDGSYMFVNDSSKFYMTDYGKALMNKWHVQDPVSEKELTRNDGVQSTQGNRNPYVDHPEWADKIFGSNYEDTHGTPSTDPYIKITASSTTMEVGGSVTLTAEIVNTTGGTINWNVEDSSTDVVTLSANSGATITVNGAGEGTKKIYATWGTLSKYVSITVNSSGGGGGDDPGPEPSGEGGEEITAEISFTGSKSSSTDSKGYVWSVNQDGTYTTGASYLRLDNSSTFISNQSPISMDTTQTVSITANLRTYDGAHSQSLKVGAYNSSGTLISNELVLSPTSKSLSPYSGTLTFTTTDYSNITIKAFNGNDYKLGISGMTIVYTELVESQKTIETIEIDTAPDKVTYTAGECFDPTGLVLLITYDDDSTEEVDYTVGISSSFTFVPSTLTPLTTNNDSVSITYAGETVSQSITVNAAKTLSSITISGYTTAFVEGDAFSFGGTVTAHYSDSTTDNVTASATFSGYTMTSTGNQTVTVSYGGKSASYGITISKGTLSSIALSGQTTTYTKNATFSFNGTCTATFANGYQKVVSPTSVSSPDMSTTGTKQVTVSFTYNSVTKSQTYNITVTAYRQVMEVAYSTLGTIVYTAGTEAISINTLSTGGKTGYSQIDTSNHAYRLGSGNYPGSIKVISTTANIYKITANAKAYGSDTGVTLSIAGTANTLTSSYADYTKEFTSAVSEVNFETSVKNKRALISSFTVYTKTEQDIGQSNDCVGLETFIGTYMHMEYTESKGWCNDSEHHYYSTAKAAFNALNEHQRSLFVGNSAYSVEWARLSTWASKNGDYLNSSNELAKSSKVVNPVVISESTNNVMLVVIISIIGLTAISGYFLIKKRKED